jgi:lipid A disaccharide synthetase
VGTTTSTNELTGLDEIVDRLLAVEPEEYCCFTQPGQPTRVNYATIVDKNQQDWILVSRLHHTHQMAAILPKIESEVRKSLPGWLETARRIRETNPTLQGLCIFQPNASISQYQRIQV